MTEETKYGSIYRRYELREGMGEPNGYLMNMFLTVENIVTMNIGTSMEVLNNLRKYLQMPMALRAEY